MELKRILARDAASATEEVLARYGQDTLIISTRRVNNMTELIVAVDLPGGAAAPQPEARPSSEAPRDAFAGVLARALNGRTPPPRAERSPDSPAAAEAPVASQPQAASGEPVSSRLQVPSGEAASSGATAPAAAAILAELAGLRAEVAALKAVLLERRGPGDVVAPEAIRPPYGGGAPDLDSPPDAAADPFEAAALSALSPALRERLAGCARGARSAEDALERVRAALASRIAPQPEALDPPAGLHLVAGADGCGKTTAAVKLARLGAMRLGSERVALISYASACPGAWAQLTVMCAPLGIDCFRAADPHALKALVDELLTRRLLVIDHGNGPAAEDASRTRGLLKDMGLDKRVRWHLVLPADASSASIRRMLARVGQGWHDAIVSRLDLAGDPWPAIEALHEAQLPLGWCSDSRDLHAGLRNLSAQALVSRALAEAA